MSNVYICQDCGLDYLLSEERITQDSPSKSSFICDLCAEEEGECDVCEAKDGEPHCDCGNCDCGDN